MSKNVGHRMGFDDTTINSRERIEFLKFKTGLEYRVVLLDTPTAVYVGNVRSDTKNTGFSALSLAPYDVCHAANEGDEACLKQAKKLCPLWARGYKVSRRFIAPVLIVGVGKQGKVRPKSEYGVMRFGEKIYARVRDAMAQVPPTKEGKPRRIQAIEWAVTCSDAQFQDLNFVYAGATRVSTPDQIKEAIVDGLQNPDDPKEGFALVNEACVPDSHADLVRSLDRFENVESDEDGDDDSVPARRRGKRDEDGDDDEVPAKSGKRRSVEPDDEGNDDETPPARKRSRKDDDDESDEGDEDTEADADADDEDEAPPPARKPKGHKIVVSSKGKAAKPKDASEEIDDLLAGI